MPKSPPLLTPLSISTSLTEALPSFQIAQYRFEHPFVLAPMAGITDRVFRQICRQHGAAYAVGEMVASQKQLRESAKSSTRHADRSEPAPRAVQLLGTDPQLLADAARWQVKQGAQIIDLNLGCPAKKVCSVAAGSALMGYPKKVAEIFAAMVNAVPENIPVTVKIRTGTDAQHKNALEIAHIAENEGLQALTIHGRTRADKFQGQAEYDTIAHVKQHSALPIIANGDITTPEHARFILKYTQADALMIGRASLGNPWIFQQMLHPHNPPPSLETVKQVMMQHFSGLHQLYGEVTGVRHSRKHFAWYLEKHPFPEKSLRRQQFNQLSTPQEQCEMIQSL